MLNILLHNKEFWAAVILLITALVNWLAPGIPKEVISAILALLGVISGVLAGQIVARYLAMVRGAYRK